MKVYTYKTFRGHWPVGTAAVVVDESPHQAAEQLMRVLKLEGLEQTVEPKEMIEVMTKHGSCRILCNGDY